MKKLLTFTATLMLICALFLTGCVNQGMADKINEKAKSDEGYTYQQLIKDYKNLQKIGLSLPQDLVMV